MVSGRQRSFDTEQALASAMRVFWQKGYIGASLSELCSAMAINKPSLYAAFGNKESLFLSATDYYVEHHAKPHMSLLQGASPLCDRVMAYMLSVVKAQCSEEQPKGCYISVCVSEFGSEDLPPLAEQKVAFIRDFAQQFLNGFFLVEQGLEHMPSDVDPAVIARTLIALLHGTASLSRGGMVFNDLKPVVKTAVSNLPLVVPS